MIRHGGLTSPEVGLGAGPSSTLAVPVGSTEQHGPHLPVTTDTDIAVAVAAGLARACSRVVVAPALAYGSSGEHRGFPGTLSIGRRATELVLVELGRSATADFAQIILVSTHGGNSAPVAGALARLRAEGRQVASWSPAWGGDLHAGRTETSLMLAIAPDRVRLDRARRGDPRPLAALLPQLRQHGVRSVSSNGVLGDPAGASAAEGRRLLQEAVEDLAGLARRLQGGMRDVEAT